MLNELIAQIHVTYLQDVMLQFNALDVAENN
jgi:hypothetical protein